MTTAQQTLYSIIVNFINTGIIMLQPFYLLKFRRRRVIAAYFCTIFFSYLFFLLTRAVVPDNILPRIAINFAVILMIDLLVFRDSFKRKLTCFFAQVFITAVSEVMSIYLLWLLNPADSRRIWDITENSDVSMRGIIFANMLIFILSMYFVLIWKRRVEKLKLRGMLLYLILPLYQFVQLIIFFDQAAQFDGRTASLGVSMLVMGIVVDIIMMYLLQTMEQKVTVEEKLSTLYRQRQNELDYYQMTRQHIEQMRIIRHDFINQIQTAYMMIQEGSTPERAKALLADSYQQLADARLTIYCENPVINALISVKAVKAEERDIAFSVEGTMGDLSGMEEIDLCSLFGNMLDNAIEACSRIPQGEERRLILKVTEKGGYQMIRTENTYSKKEQEGDFFRTSKEDRLNHGYGMKLIERICKKYGGELKTQVKEKEVYITAYLSLELTKGSAKEETKDGK